MFTTASPVSSLCVSLCLFLCPLRILSPLPHSSSPVSSPLFSSRLPPLSSSLLLSLCHSFLFSSSHLRTSRISLCNRGSATGSACSNNHVQSRTIVMPAAMSSTCVGHNYSACRGLVWCALRGRGKLSSSFLYTDWQRICSLCCSP